MKTLALRWRNELVLLCIAGMEITWFSSWGALLAGSATAPLHRAPWGAWLGLFLLALYLVRGLSALRVPLGAQASATALLAMGASAGLIVSYGYSGYPADRSQWLSVWLDNLVALRGSGLWGLALPLLASYCAVRGALLAHQRVTARAVHASLVAGAVAWVLYTLLAMMLDQPAIAPAWAFAFSALAVLGSGLAYLEEARRARIAARAAAGYWSALVVVCAAALTGAGVLVASAASWLLSGALSRAIAWLQSLHQQIPKWIEWLIETLFPWRVLPIELTPTPTPTPGLGPPPSPPDTSMLPDWLKLVVVGAILMGLVVLIVAPWLRRRVVRPTSPGPSGWDSGPVDYERGLRRAVRRLRGRARARGPRPPVELGTARQIYGSVLRLAAWWGVAREEKETPYEYQRRLLGTEPQMEAPLGTITEAYVRARYGGVELTDGEVERLRAEWEQVRERMEE